VVPNAASAITSLVLATAGLLPVASPAWAEAPASLPAVFAVDPGMKDLRRQMLAGTELSDVNLRRLADAGEGLAAARYAQRLEERGNAALLADIAHYYSVAVYVDRDFALPRLVAVLDRNGLKLGPARSRSIREVLENQANKGNTVAASGLADLLLKGHPFGQDVPKAREMLQLAAEAGDAQASIRLALSFLQGAPDLPPDPEAARPALKLAAASSDPGVQSMAVTLWQRLPGDEPLAVKAVIAPPVVENAAATVEAVLRPRPRPVAIAGAAP
jgi:TPR repeat protein